MGKLTLPIKHTQTRVQLRQIFRELEHLLAKSEYKKEIRKSCFDFCQGIYGIPEGAAKSITNVLPRTHIRIGWILRKKLMEFRFGFFSQNRFFS